MASLAGPACSACPKSVHPGPFPGFLAPVAATVVAWRAGDQQDRGNFSAGGAQRSVARRREHAVVVGAQAVGAEFCVAVSSGGARAAAADG